MEANMPITAENLVKINDKNQVDVKIGDLLVYKYALSEQTSIDAGCIIDNKDVITLVDDHVTHFNPIRNGDEVTQNSKKSRGTFLFKAIAKGKANVIIKQHWQGYIHKTHTITVNVK
jgi:hypothetical protein